MVLESGIAEDHALLSEARDGKERPFRVGLVAEDYVHHFGDLTCFVGEAVHIVHRYGVRDAPGAYTFCTDKVFIYEIACSCKGIALSLPLNYKAILQSSLSLFKYY